MKLKRIYIYAYIDYNYQQQQEKKTNRECGYRDCLDNIVVVVIVKKCRRGGEEEKKEIIYYGNKNRIDILAHIQISFYYQHGWSEVESNLKPCAYTISFFCALS